MPVVFSWPVLPSTVQPTDFEIELNTGDIIVPDGVSIAPALDLNERNTVVLISPDIGNRLHPDSEGAIYPVTLRIVEDESPLQLVGPGGPVSAVGLSYNTIDHPYVHGPRMVAAKLSKMNSIGDDPPPGIA